MLVLVCWCWCAGAGAGAGDGTIGGGAGNDILSGGEGDDVFSFITGFGVDTITDLGGNDGNNDKLDRSETEGLTLAGLLAAATFSNMGRQL